MDNSPFQSSELWCENDSGPSSLYLSVGEHTLSQDRMDNSPLLRSALWCENDSGPSSLYLSGLTLERLALESLTCTHQQRTDSQDTLPSSTEHDTSKMPYVNRVEVLNASKLTKDQMELIPDLHLKISCLNEENANLKEQVAEKNRQLKELGEDSMRRLKSEPSSMQWLYEDKAKMVRRLEEKERSWQQENGRLSRLVSELQEKVLRLEKRNSDLEHVEKQNCPGFDEPDGNTAADNTLISELYKQLSRLRDAVRKQNDVIVRLMKRKSAERSQGVSSDVPRGSGIPESVPVYCQHDIERLDLDHKEDKVYQAEVNSSVWCEVPYPPDINKTSARQGSAAMVVPQNRTTSVARHTYDVGAPIIRSQGGGAARSTDDVQPGVGSFGQGVTSNGPPPALHVPAPQPRPACGESDNRGAGAVVGSASAREEAGTVRECPVCNALFPLEVSFAQFEEHVNAHFEPEFDVLSP